MIDVAWLESFCDEHGGDIATQVRTLLDEHTTLARIEKVLDAADAVGDSPEERVENIADALEKLQNEQAEVDIGALKAVVAAARELLEDIDESRYTGPHPLWQLRESVRTAMADDAHMPGLRFD